MQTKTMILYFSHPCHPRKGHGGLPPSGATQSYGASTVVFASESHNNNSLSNAMKKKSSNFLEDNSSSLQTLNPSKEGNFVCTMCMEAKASALEWVDVKDCSNAYCKDCMVKLNMFC